VKLCDLYIDPLIVLGHPWPSKMNIYRQNILCTFLDNTRIEMCTLGITRLEICTLWASPSFLSNGYRGYFPGGKAAGAWRWQHISI